jgi:hypothetical protein
MPLPSWSKAEEDLLERVVLQAAKGDVPVSWPVIAARMNEQSRVEKTSSRNFTVSSVNHKWNMLQASGVVPFGLKPPAGEMRSTRLSREAACTDNSPLPATKVQAPEQKTQPAGDVGATAMSLQLPLPALSHLPSTEAIDRETRNGNGKRSWYAR